MPIAGSLIAVIFFRLVYLKTQFMIEKDSEKEDNLDDIKKSIGDGVLRDDWISLHSKIPNY